MTISREIKKIEAVARMKMWGIFPQTVEQFEKEELVSASEPPFGACYWLDEAQQKRVKAFEEQNNALVYHVIRCFTTIGEMEHYLYVSDYQEEWGQDRADIQAGEQMAYVFNKDAPDCSEFGYIGIARTPAAGLARTW